MKTVEQCKDEIAKKEGYGDYADLIGAIDMLSGSHGKRIAWLLRVENEAMALYAAEATKEKEGEIKKLENDLREARKEAQSFMKERDRAFAERNEARECEEHWKARSEWLEKYLHTEPQEDDLERYPLPLCFDPQEEQKELWGRSQRIKRDHEQWEANFKQMLTQREVDWMQIKQKFMDTNFDRTISNIFEWLNMEFSAYSSLPLKFTGQTN